MVACQLLFIEQLILLTDGESDKWHDKTNPVVLYTA